MLLRLCLLSVLAVSCVVGEWPCPVATDIEPCLCTSDSNLKLTMDCSAVKNSNTLAKIFQTHFSFTDFKKLIIKPSSPSDTLQVLDGGVFGDVSFAEIEIAGTHIHTIAEQALVNSHKTLTNLLLKGNDLREFPFETLDLFTALVELDISNNKFSAIAPDIVSDTLLTVDMSGNIYLRLTESTFQSAPFIEVLHLSRMGLQNSTPPHVFNKLKSLKVLDIHQNDISGEMIEFLVNPELDPLVDLSFKDNKITQIHRLAITGMADTGYAYFENNEIEYLHRENWEGLVSQLSVDNAIDLRNNPLVCGCDVMWLVMDRDLMRIFHNKTTCKAGNYMVDLPREWFLEHCT